MRQLVDAKDSDLFDVLAYILFTNKPVTREARATVVEKYGLQDFDKELQAMLVAFLKSYVTNGERELGTKKLGQYSLLDMAALPRDGEAGRAGGDQRMHIGGCRSGLLSLSYMRRRCAKGAFSLIRTPFCYFFASLEPG